MTPPTRSPSPDDGLKGLPGGGVYPIEFSPEFLASIDASQEGGDAGDIYGIKCELQSSCLMIRAMC
jgi:hypothetical protein